MIRQVGHNLYVGGKPRLDECQRHGVRALVTVCRKKPDDEVARYYDDLWARHHLPLQDGMTLENERYWQAAAVVKHYVDGGNRTLVHCLAGRNRSCLVAALVLVVSEGISGTEALQRILAVRPNAFHNPIQRKWLESVR